MIQNFKKLLLDNGIEPKGIIQIGSHFFQEKEEFLEAGIKNFVLIEPQKHAFSVLKERAKDLPGALLYNVAISNFNGRDDMLCDTNNDGQSSSLLVPKRHLIEYPGITFPRTENVEVWKLDNISFNRENYNILFMDIQGNELNALKGAIDTLFWIDAIYTEVNIDELYEGCGKITELEDFLKSNNFKRAAIGQVNNGWTDAFYIKK